jgi:pimeloyl-ACP methyl ester carboxylesterase
LTPPELAQEIVDLIKGSKLTVIPDAGHLVNIEEPDMFNREVIDFILNQRGLA